MAIMNPVTRLALPACTALLIILVGCSQESSSRDAEDSGSGQSEYGSVSITGAGATFPQPLYKRWMDVYREEHPDVTFSYEGVGSGEGIKRFLAEEVDFGASDAALSDADLAKVGPRGAVMVPMTAGMVVLAYNVPSIGKGLRLPRDVVSDIFAGKIDYWDDPRIETANPGITLPHRGITPVVRRDSSGTTFILTNHLAAANDWWRDQGPGAGKQVDWPGRAMEVNYNEGVAQRVKISEGAIGYMEYEFAERLGLPIATLQNKAGRYVVPTPRAGTAALASITGIPEDLRVFAPDPPGADAYPIVSYTWLLLYGRYPETAKRDALKDAVTWGLTEGQPIAEQMGYIPLPDEMVRLAKAKIESIN
jgi:phosphate transport system substrate-binding protein